MDTRDLIALFRKEVNDEALPRLWTDAQIYSYLDDAQKMFCRLHGGIADSTSSIAKIVARAGRAFGTLDPRILKVRYASRANDFVEVKIINFEDIQNGVLPLPDDSSYRFGLVNKLDDTQGLVRYMITGMEMNKVRFVYIPAEDVTISLITYRLPLETISEENPAELELDEQHHRHLLYWMKHLAYGNQDAETYDRTKMEQFGAAFQAYCAQAKAERERREHKPRLITYGGL